MIKINRLDTEIKESVLEIIEEEDGLTREELLLKYDFESEEEAGFIVSTLMDMGYITVNSKRQFIIRKDLNGA
jgi:hypothetical protein